MKNVTKINLIITLLITALISHSQGLTYKLPDTVTAVHIDLPINALFQNTPMKLFSMRQMLSDKNHKIMNTLATIHDVKSDDSKEPAFYSTEVARPPKDTWFAMTLAKEDTLTDVDIYVFNDEIRIETDKSILNLIEISNDKDIKSIYISLKEPPTIQ